MRFATFIKYSLIPFAFGLALFFANKAFFVYGQTTVDLESIQMQIDKHNGLYNNQKSILIGILQSIHDEEFLSEAGLDGGASSESIWEGTRILCEFYPSPSRTIALVLFARAHDDSLVNRKLYVVSLDKANRKGAYVLAGECRRNAAVNALEFEDKLRGKIMWKVKATDLNGPHAFEGEVDSFDPFPL